jgi:hypothetical protein
MLIVVCPATIRAACTGGATLLNSHCHPRRLTTVENDDLIHEAQPAVFDRNNPGVPVVFHHGQQRSRPRHVVGHFVGYSGS